MPRIRLRLDLFEQVRDFGIALLNLYHVINDITGLTGLTIVDAILEGERDPAKLAQLRHYRIKADQETIRKSLEGNWRREHLFTLRQSRNAYSHYQSEGNQPG